jgi:hypothetical protein
MKLSSFSFLENILLQHFKSRQRIGVNFVKGPKNFFLPPLSPKVSGIPETARLSGAGIQQCSGSHKGCSS